MRKKLISRSGFTLIEMVVSTLVLALLVLAISGGLSVATSVYRSSVYSSESEVLQSTINTSLSDVLRYAKYSETGSGGTVCFTNSTYGIASGHFLTVEGRIYMNPGSGDDSDISTLILLVNSGAYTSLEVSDFRLEYDAQTAMFSGSYLITLPGSSPLTKNCGFTFKSVAYQQAS